MDIGRLLLATSTALTVAACSAEPPPADAQGSATQRPSVPSQAASPSLYGRWRIVEVNGTPARSFAPGRDEQPSVSFTPRSYGGFSGCNRFGGSGLALGDRWFAEPPIATQQGCSGSQESDILSVLAGGPTVAWESPDTAMLRTTNGRLRLRRTVALPGTDRPDPAPMLLAGTRWELHRLDGAPLASGAREPARLTFEADQWTLETPCGTRTGAWRQAEGAVVLELGSGAARSCPAEQAEAAQALTRILTGDLRYVVGPNGEFVLAAPQHWLTGRREREFGQGDPDLLSGRWRITVVDGGPPPPPRERPAGLAFGSGYYGVWDGCRHSEGVAIARERQLFTHGSGAVTDANCTADPIRSTINAVVASSPRIARTTDGGLALISRDGALRLQRTSAQPFGVGVERRLRSGQAFDVPTGPGQTARLTLGPGDRFTLALKCTTLQGRWRAAHSLWGPYTRFGPDGPRPECAGSPDEESLYRFFMRDVQAVIGPNKDIALFVSNGEGRPARMANHRRDGSSPGSGSP